MTIFISSSLQISLLLPKWFVDTLPLELPRVMVNARPTPRVCVCAAERTGTYRAFLLGAIATLAGVADGFGAAPRAATGTSASVLRGAAACARAGPGVGRVSGHWGHCTRCEVVAARGSAAGAEGVAEEEDEEEDGERGPHGYVSILRSAVLRGCNVTLMARVHGNYKKRKLNIEHIVPWDTVYEEIAQLFYEVGMQVHGRPLSPPNIIFWNVRADTYGYPAAADQQGVMLFSGTLPP